MTILNQQKAKLVNHENSMRNPDLRATVYINTAKAPQYRLVAENRREK